MRVLLLDNHDSFSWNLVHALRQLGAAVDVAANDGITVEQALSGGAEALVVSPGPGRPDESGICLELVAAAIPRLPLLGVCLGHQALAQVCGGRIVPAPTLMHGKTSLVQHAGRELYRGLPRPFVAMRYHSLMVDAAALPVELEVTARAADGVIMGLRHRERPVWGVQFHPESILTAAGPALLANFLSLARARRAGAPRAA